MDTVNFISQGICKSERCTACGVCLNTCPAKAITYSTNIYGELHPHIDHSRCIMCGLCIKKCPNNNAVNFYKPLHCFASWTTNIMKRAECASGGIATILSEYIIKRKKGVVFGTAYDSNLTPEITWVENIKDLDKFKGSKYVKSIVHSTTLKKVAHFLAKGRYVLFIGTPCQIAGLKSFLEEEHEKLLTIDLLCHGVSPVSYFHEEINYLKQKYKIKKITNIRFRGNDDDNTKMTLFDRLIGRYYSNNFRFSLWNTDIDGNPKRVYCGDSTENFYLAGFLKGITLRENCYTCLYARPERVADITLGDFIGLGKNELLKYKKENASVVLTNTQKGLNFYSSMIHSEPDIISIERQYSERLLYPYSLTEPFPRNPLTNVFRELLCKYGYRRAISSVLRRQLFKEWIFNRLKHFKLLPWYAWCKIKIKFFKSN